MGRLEKVGNLALASIQTMWDIYYDFDNIITNRYTFILINTTLPKKKRWLTNHFEILRIIYRNACNRN